MEKSKFMMIIILVLLVVLLGTVVGVSFYVLNLVRNQAAMADEATTESGSTQKTQAAKQLTQEEITKVVLGDPIVTNLASGPDGVSHIAKIGILVGYDNSVKTDSEAFATLLSENLEYARYIALTCIYSSTYEDLSEPEGMTKLANDIKEKLQDEFNTTLIVDVYFNERTLQ